MTSTTCPGSYGGPRTSAGRLCVYVGGSTEGVDNAHSFGVRPVGGLGFELVWRARTAGEIMTLLQTLNQEGQTCIIVTHDPSVASRTDRTVYLRDGRVDHKESRN